MAKNQNKLIYETSPYLLQHAHNPVDWYPWGDEAFRKALENERPIFLSIGYSSCHWCHVMEVESFESQEVAEILNRDFVSIKVDREERPDVDQIYMTAVQAMNHHGGWPLSVFLTPHQKPFYGGTYFPPDDRPGIPSFKRVLLGVSTAWKNNRQEILKSASEFSTLLIKLGEIQKVHDMPSLSSVDSLINEMKWVYDSENGGVGSAPKFFHVIDFKLCLRHWKRTGDKQSLAMVTKTIDRISRGGIYDHLGGGFHRYSTDAVWTVPHFEKMLYDQALIMGLLLEAYQCTLNESYARTIRHTLQYILRDMTSSEGGFFSSQDADSDGVEGKFYVWSKGEIRDLLGNKSEAFCDTFQITNEGNWDGQNIIYRHPTNENLLHFEDEKNVLLDARTKRTPPFRDEKIIASWNGMMIQSMALAYQVLENREYLEASLKAADFILERLWDQKKKQLQHVYKDGQAKVPAFLDDYASLIEAFVTLYETTFDLKWIDSAVALSETMVSDFWNSDEGSFFYTSQQQDNLIVRMKDYYDSATPSSTGVGAMALIRLGKITGSRPYLEIAERTLQTFSKTIQDRPMSVGQLIFAVEFLAGRPKEIVIVPGVSVEEYRVVLRYLRQTFHPDTVLLRTPQNKTSNELLLTKDKVAIDGRTTVYICENQTCQTPVSEIGVLKKIIF